jgi:hypothetical protein
MTAVIVIAYGTQTVSLYPKPFNINLIFSSILKS